MLRDALILSRPTSSSRRFAPQDEVGRTKDARQDEVRRRRMLLSMRARGVSKEGQTETPRIGGPAGHMRPFLR